MKTVQMSDLTALIEHAHPLSISIYMPSHRGGSQTRQDPIRFKNLLRKAEQQLVEHGMAEGNAKQRLAPVTKLLLETDFWRHQDSGLAVFINEGQPRIFNLPYSTDEMVFVGDSYYVKPLLPMVGEDGQFFILALGQEHVRIFEATRYDINQLKLDAVPESFAEFDRYVEQQKSLQLHTPGHQGTENAKVYHAHGGGADEANVKRQLEQFCILVNQGLMRFLNNRRAPLVLAASEPLAGIYRRVNEYPNLHDQVIHGSPERLKPNELLAQADGLLQSYFESCTRQAADNFQTAAAMGKASQDPEKIVAAAFEGKVDSLLVSVEDHLWGVFDQASGQLTLHKEQQAGDQDLLDFAAAKSFQHGGAVYGLRRDEMPNGVMAAATFRYVNPPAEAT